MTTHEQDTKILKNYIQKCIETIEKGDKAYIRGGYIQHTYEESLIDSNCDKIVEKLKSLGYEFSTNHGHGCFDYAFYKPINL